MFLAPLKTQTQHTLLKFGNVLDHAVAEGAFVSSGWCFSLGAEDSQEDKEQRGTWMICNSDTRSYQDPGYTLTQPGALRSEISEQRQEQD